MLRKTSLLIVEDDHLVAMEMESVLLGAGFAVTGIAATAEDALRQARSGRPDLALMDIRLAGARDGADAALDLFRQMGIRCVFATAHHDKSTRLRAQPAQPLGWLSKPYPARRAPSGRADGALCSQALTFRECLLEPAES